MKIYVITERYHEGDMFPYVFIMNCTDMRAYRKYRNLQAEAYEWCEDQFGQQAEYDDPKIDSGCWFGFSGMFRFRDKADAAAFKIRWHK